MGLYLEIEPLRRHLGLNEVSAGGALIQHEEEETLGEHNREKLYEDTEKAAICKPRIEVLPGTNSAITSILHLLEL